jgi:hypothetical protein
MALQVIAFIGLGMICSVVANLPALLKLDKVAVMRGSNSRLWILLVAQSLLFAGYGLLITVMRQQSWIASLKGAALIGTAFGLMPVVLAGRQSRATLGRNVQIAVTIAACTIAAFLITPMFRGG